MDKNRAENLGTSRVNAHGVNIRNANGTKNSGIANANELDNPGISITDKNRAKILGIADINGDINLFTSR